MTEIRMEAEIVFDTHVPTALRRALDYAGDEGYVASLPQLLHARANAPYDNIIWNTWFTSYTEENVVTTPQGTHVIVVVHGGGIYASPERFEQTYRASVDRSSPEGFTGQYSGKLSPGEASDVLNGRLPDGTEIPIYPSTNSGRASRTCRGATVSFSTTSWRASRPAASIPSRSCGTSRT